MCKNEPPLGLAHPLFHDHVFLIIGIGSSVSGLLRRTMVLNRSSFIGYTMTRYFLLIVLSMCNLMTWILRPWAYQEISFWKACIGYHQKSTVKKETRKVVVIYVGKNVKQLGDFKSGNCSSSVRIDILMAHLRITMSSNHLAKHFVIWITMASEYGTRKRMKSDRR